MSCIFNNSLRTVLRNKVVIQQIRFYPRWNSRRPVKVYTPEEYENVERKVDDRNTENNVFEKYGVSKHSWEEAETEKNDVKEGIKYKLKPKKVEKPLVATNQKSKVMPTMDMLETIIDKDGNFIYTKMKNNDQRVGKILTEVKSKKEKEKKDLILLEGKRLIKDALLSGCRLKYILFTRMDEVNYLKPHLPKIGAQLYKMPYREMQMWSDLSTTPGIMGVFKIPNIEDFTPQNPIPVTIICDNVREPGNLGTILRICAAVGCERVILTKGCVNLWDSKVLRSSVGAHFKLRIHKSVDWNAIEDIVGDSSCYIADNKIISDESENREGLASVFEKIPLLPYYGINFSSPQKLVLIVGGETHGISKNSYELAIKSRGARLNIPLSNNVDSLNVGAALGIIAFEIKKQLSQNLVNK